MLSLRLLPLCLAVGPAALAAQQEPDSRWLPWLGCWQVGQAAEPGGALVCLRPASDPLGVEVATVTGGEIAWSRDLIADGQPHDLTLEDCVGSEVARFSTDGRRVYLRSTLTCATGQRRTASGIMAMASPSVWLDAQSLGADGEPVPQVLHYYPAPAARWPDDFRFSTERAEAVADARVLASDRLSLLDVREAASQVDSGALATFLIERAQRFDLTAAGLAALDEAEVPDAVIDALVAVSYPERFAVDRGPAHPAPPSGEPRAPDTTYVDTYAWQWWRYGSCLGSLYCDPYFYSLYDRGYWPYGYHPTWSGGFWGHVIIVDRTAAPRGTAVKGRGYSRGGQSAGTGEGRYAKPRSEPSGGSGSQTYSSSSGGSTGTSSGGSASPGGYSRSGGSSSGSSSGSAKPRGH